MATKKRNNCYFKNVYSTFVYLIISTFAPLFKIFLNKIERGDQKWKKIRIKFLMKSHKVIINMALSPT